MDMLQIDEWAAVAAIAALFIVALGYFIYFKVSRKLFPQMQDFDNEIESGQGATVSNITGSGIVQN